MPASIALSLLAFEPSGESFLLPRPSFPRRMKEHCRGRADTLVTVTRAGSQCLSSRVRLTVHSIPLCFQMILKTRIFLPVFFSAPNAGSCSKTCTLATELHCQPPATPVSFSILLVTRTCYVHPRNATLFISLPFSLLRPLPLHVHTLCGPLWHADLLAASLSTLSTCCIPFQPRSSLSA